MTISSRGRKAIRFVIERAALAIDNTPSNLLARIPNCNAKTIVELLTWLELPDTDGWAKRLEGIERRKRRRQSR
jgi:hypothetical protein